MPGLRKYKRKAKRTGQTEQIKYMIGGMVIADGLHQHDVGLFFCTINSVKNGRLLPN